MAQARKIFIPCCILLLISVIAVTITVLAIDTPPQKFDEEIKSLTKKICSRKGSKCSSSTTNIESPGVDCSLTEERKTFLESQIDFAKRLVEKFEKEALTKQNLKSLQNFVEEGKHRPTRNCTISNPDKDDSLVFEGCLAEYGGNQIKTLYKGTYVLFLKAKVSFPSSEAANRKAAVIEVHITSGSGSSNKLIQVNPIYQKSNNNVVSNEKDHLIYQKVGLYHINENETLSVKMLNVNKDDNAVIDRSNSYFGYYKA